MASQFCNACPHSSVKKFSSDTIGERYNCYCDYKENNSKLVELSAKFGTFVETPAWCPLNKPQVEEKKVAVSLTPYEIKERLKKLKPFSKWEDIKEGHVYHIPPLYPGDKRKDVYVTYKSSTSVSYKVLGAKNTYAINTLYPSSVEVNFLVPHKIMNFEIITSGAK